LQNIVQTQGAKTLAMDVGVLTRGNRHVDISNDEVANASGSSLKSIGAFGDENAAMSKMAESAIDIAMHLYLSNRIHAVLALGGMMGTDLAFDVANSL
jgi:uncharacterized protein (UPF0261 family)